MASSSQPPPRTSGRVRAPPIRYRSKSVSQLVSAPNKSTVGADTVVEPCSNGGGCPDAAVTHPVVAVVESGSAHDSHDSGATKK